MLSRDRLVQVPQPLEIIEHILEPTELTCSGCGRKLRPSDDVEELALVDQSHVLKKHVRRKYLCECGTSAVAASGPRAVATGARYSIDFACEVAANKYHLAIPLERQARTLTLQGLDVDSATLWEQLDKLARLLVAPYDALRAHVLRQELVHVAELPWATPIKATKVAKSAKTWWVWSIASHDAVYYQLAPVRGHAVLSEMLKGFTNTLMFDELSVYQAAKDRLPGMTSVLSWANLHASFVAASTSEIAARRALELLDELFEVERDQPAWRSIQDEQRRAIALEYICEVRRERCAPVCDALLKWAHATREAHPQPGSPLHVALELLLDQWPSLTQFLSRPELPLSAAAAPRQAHQGSKSLRGSEVSALFYTLVESAKLARVDPQKYLCAAAEAALVGDEKAPLLPAQLRASRRPAAFL